MITPQDFSDITALIQKSGTVNATQNTPLREFLELAKAKELSDAYLLAKDNRGGQATVYIDQCLTVLNLRLQEEAAQATEKHIIEVQNLTAQNKILILESVKLGALTKWIVGLTFGLLFLTAALLIRDCCKETHTVDVINNFITITNVPVNIVVTNTPNIFITNIPTAIITNVITK